MRISAVTHLRQAMQAVVRPTVAAIIKECVPVFRSNRGEIFMRCVQRIRGANATVYGIHKESHGMGEALIAEHYSSVKAHLLQDMDLSPDTKMIEVIGSTTPFSLQDVETAMHFLQKTLPPECVILYGYTGRVLESGERCANAVVTNYLIEKGWLSKAVGTLVAPETVTALNNGCSGPDLQRYLLIHGEGVRFGDVGKITRYLADELIVLGGDVLVQPQVTAFRTLHKPVTLAPGL